MWDSGSPVLNATVVRIVLIDAPCPDSSVSYFCENQATGRSFCSGAYGCQADVRCAMCHIGTAEWLNHMVVHACALSVVTAITTDTGVSPAALWLHVSQLLGQHDRSWYHTTCTTALLWVHSRTTVLTMKHSAHAYAPLQVHHARKHRSC